MRVLFVGVYADQEMVSYVNHNSEKSAAISVAAIKYTRLIGEGLKYEIGDKSTNLFLVPMGMYPVCKSFFWTTYKKDDNYYIPFVNILLVKQISIALYLFCFSIYWYFKSPKDEKKIIMFSFVYLPFLIGVVPVKLLRNAFVTTFVPDMPEYEFSYSKTGFSVKKILVPLYIRICKKIVSITDYFVFITKYMVDKYSIRPYSVIEGFTDVKNDTEDSVYYTNKNAIMYAGALFEKFGVKVLIEAFMNIKGDYELWLFGSGDMEEEILSFLKIDFRIKYFGNRPNEEILVYEKKAKLLVNPRFSSQEFTKFSFPSKLMEYMASGTPVLTTRLLGIPGDYGDKMFYIDEETTNGLEESILKCLTMSENDLNLFGKRSQEYVLKGKNNKIQIKKIIELINDKI